jgi:hypothetical protein
MTPITPAMSSPNGLASLAGDAWATGTETAAPPAAFSKASLAESSAKTETAGTSTAMAATRGMRMKASIRRDSIAPVCFRRQGAIGLDGN